MRPPLFEDIRSLLYEGKDFAYICRFKDLEREKGDELIFETEQKPILTNNNPQQLLNEKIPEILDNIHYEGNPMVPVFLSYELIENIYNLKLKNRSSWPLIGTLIPSAVRSAEFTRSSPGYSRLKSDFSKVSDEGRYQLESNIGEVVERIRNGEMLQTVLSNRFDVKEFDAFELMKYMLLQDRSRYVYYYKFGEYEIVGSSPESVFVRQGRNLTIHPIAGTRRRADGPDPVLIEDLLGDNKELCEHRMLVDLARNDLSRVCEPGTVNVVSDMVPEKFYSVIHLTSVVNGLLADDVTPYDIISAVFPAGTVSGAPKRRAMEIIDRYENHGRGIYGGSVGVIGNNSADLALPIRTVYRNASEAYVQAGAGIVKDSVPSNEINEMMAKANTIMAGGLSCA